MSHTTYLCFQLPHETKTHVWRTLIRWRNLQQILKQSLPNRTTWCLNLERGPPSFATKFNYFVLWRHRITQTDDSMSRVQTSAGWLQSLWRDQGRRTEAVRVLLQAYTDPSLTTLFLFPNCQVGQQNSHCHRDEPVQFSAYAGRKLTYGIPCSEIPASTFEWLDRFS
jgi:hypothetical protein